MKNVKSVWTRIKKPIMVLAPMEDVTDTVFRRIVASCARPDVFFTEFTSVDGLFSRGRDEVMHRFDYTDEEKPIIAQVWGTDPELFYKAAQLVSTLAFDGMDINMGCPEKNVTSRGAGACLIDDHPRVSEIIAAAHEGLGSASRRIPLSIKTRLGYKKIAPDWIPFLLSKHIDALIIHGRTAVELSKVPAHWDEIGKAVKARKDDIVIIGNGDVTGYADAVEKCETFGVDGVMIGRGIFENLWAFDKTGVSHMENPSVLFDIARTHIRLFDEVWGTGKNFAVLKKFFKIYVHGFPHASEIREKLMQTNNRSDAEAILKIYEK